MSTDSIKLIIDQVLAAMSKKEELKKSNSTEILR